MSEETKPKGRRHVSPPDKVVITREQLEDLAIGRSDEEIAKRVREFLKRGVKTKRTIDMNQVFQLVARNWSIPEIAGFLGVSEKTLDRRLKNDPEFQKIWKRGKATCTGSIRSAQWDSAVRDKNPTMLIWLGKQLLGQRDEFDVGVQHTHTLSIEDFRKLLAANREKRGIAPPDPGFHLPPASATNGHSSNGHSQIVDATAEEIKSA